MTQRCHFGPSPPGMRKCDAASDPRFVRQPERTMLRVIRSLKAGDFGASQARVLCLTTALGIRDGGWAKVLLNAIELGRASATLGACRYYSAIPCGGPGFLRWTQLHSASPRQYQKPRNSSSRSSLGREGKRNAIQQTLSFLKPEIEIWSLSPFTFPLVWASPPN